MALWKPTCDSENPLPEIHGERQTERFGWKHSSHLTVAETLMLSSPQVGKIPVNGLPVRAALVLSTNWHLSFCLLLSSYLNSSGYSSAILLFNKTKLHWIIKYFHSFFSLKLIFSFHSKTILPQEIFFLPSTFSSNQAYFVRLKSNIHPFLNTDLLTMDLGCFHSFYPPTTTTITWAAADELKNN